VGRIAEKYKDKRPGETVGFIQDKLERYGIKTGETWYDSGVENCYSLRVCIEGTDVGANGKGMTKEYARASGYAEFMERLENMMLYIGQIDTKIIKETGFWLAPDERQISPRELAEMDNPLINKCLDAVSTLKDGTVLSRVEAAKRWRFNALGETGFETTLVPFFSLQNRELVELPVMMLRYVYGSNGMCAGNTPHEALLQGMSEIFERHVNQKVLVERITPPDVPEEILSNYPSVCNIIQSINAKGNYKVIVKDCSLGEGYPVVASILIDTDLQTYSVKFGAHPSFEIAVERTLTELFQGTNIVNVSRENSFIWMDSYSKDNIGNIIKNGAGIYPKEFFFKNSPYKLRDFSDVEHLSNSDLLEKAFKMILDKGYDIYIRDVSFLDFPAFHIVVPGFSEAYPMNEIRMREKNTIESVSLILKNLSDASNNELEKVIRIFRYKMHSNFENTLPFIMQLPIDRDFAGVVFPETYLVAIISYYLGRDSIAFSIINDTVKIFEKIIEKGDPKLIFLRCLRDCIGSRMDGTADKTAYEILKRFYTEEVITKAMDIVRDRDRILKKGFPVLSCPDCGLCEVKGYCSYKTVEGFLVSVGKAAAENRIDQRRLGDILPDIY